MPVPPKGQVLPRCKFRVAQGQCRKVKMVSKPAYRKCWLVLHDNQCPMGKESK